MKRIFYYVTGCVLFVFATNNVYADIQGSVVLNGAAEVQAFIDGGTGTPEVLNGDLTIKGGDVTKTLITAIPVRISEVKGSITLEGLTASGDGVAIDGFGWLNNIKWIDENGATNGGFIMRNCPYLTWPQDWMEKLKKINGDFIIDDMPSLPAPSVAGWSSEQMYGNIVEITGDFIVKKHSRNMGKGWMKYLKKVGGDVYLHYNTTGVWEIGCPLETIGGNLTIDGGGQAGMYPNGEGEYVNKFQLWTLDPLLTNIQSIGGDIKIVNCPNMPLYGGWDGIYGFCYIRYLIDEGIIDYACKKVIIGYEDEPMNLAILGGCYDGRVQGDPNDPPLPAKNPSCGGGTGVATINVSSSFASVYPTYAENEIIIDSRADLVQIEIYDLSGKLVMTIPGLQSGLNPVSVSDLTTGFYLVKLISFDSQVNVVHIIKK